MSTICPFCTSDNPVNALVCGSCSRDIAIPPSLIAERDDLLRKRDIVREELLRTKEELERLQRAKNRRTV
jgi:hypothetical protein